MVHPRMTKTCTFLFKHTSDISKLQCLKLVIGQSCLNDVILNNPTNIFTIQVNIVAAYVHCVRQQTMKVKE